MELNGRVLVRERSIKLFDGDLSLVYDPLAVKVSELRELQWVDFIVRVVRSWDLTLGGEPVPLDAVQLREMCDVQAVALVISEIGSAIYADLMTFPKAILNAPRGVAPLPTATATTSAAS